MRIMMLYMSVAGAFPVLFGRAREALVQPDRRAAAPAAAPASASAGRASTASATSTWRPGLLSLLSHDACVHLQLNRVAGELVVWYGHLARTFPVAGRI